MKCSLLGQLAFVLAVGIPTEQTETRGADYLSTADGRVVCLGERIAS